MHFDIPRKKRSELPTFWLFRRPVFGCNGTDVCKAILFFLNIVYQSTIRSTTMHMSDQRPRAAQAGPERRAAKQRRNGAYGCDSCTVRLL